MTIQFFARLGIAAALCATPVFSQTFDTSGNSQLSGTYNFREVLYVANTAATGPLSDAISGYGTIQFDGNGNYSLNGTQYSLSSGSAQAISFTGGTYSVSASGLGFIASPLSSGDTTYGLVSGGIFIGSSTESGFNDLIIAAPAGTTAPTNASLTGSYSVSDFDFPGSDPALVRDALFELGADGQGSAGSVNLTGYIAGSGATAVTQSSSVQYSFVNGAGTLTFPTAALSSSILVAGSKILYVSPDGNFIFGGSATGWDLFAGIRDNTSTLTTADFSGLYYQAGIAQDASQITVGQSSLSTYYGTFNASDGILLDHQRTNNLTVANAYDYTFDDSYTLNTDGSSMNGGLTEQYQVGQNGLARVGIGIGPQLGMTVALASPTFSGSGVFLNPIGIVNAASSAPFTTGIAPGELITLYGTGLANSTLIATDVPFPTELANVQVLVNDVPAPIYVVSPTQISALVPYELSGSIAAIQVVNNGSASNTVTSFTTITSPGAFTVPPGGVGFGAVLHADYSLVTTSNPARIGEVLQIFLSGLGAVDPAVADGAAGPLNPFSLTTNAINVYMGGVLCSLTYSGLAPSLAGLYQINAQVPSGITGNVYLDIAGPDSYNSQAVLPIAGATGTAGTASATPVRIKSHPKPAATRLRSAVDKRLGVR